jgi:undecaprenyl-diphosphatase
MFEKFLVNLVIPKKSLFVLVGISLIFLSFIGFMLLSYTIDREALLSWDVELTKSLQNLPALTSFMLFVSGFYSISLGILVFVIALGFVYLKGYPREAAFIPLVLFTPVLNSILKELVSRPRPTSALIEVFEPLPSYSYPSGHVMYYVVFFGFLAFLAISLPKLAPRWRAFILVICLPLILLVGISRIYLGAHWPSDVLGAYLIGGLYLFILILVYLKYVYRLPDVRYK